MSASALVLASLSAIAGLATLRSRSVPWPAFLSLLIAAGVFITLRLQTMPDLGWLQPNSIWDETAAALGERVARYVSVAPAVTETVGPALVVPFLVFTSALLLIRTDDEARGFLRFFAILGALIAIFGVIQYSFFPNYVLYAEKRFYKDALTGVFINRNNAATYFGITLILLITTMRDRLDLKRMIRSLYREGARQPTNREWLAFMVYAVLISATLSALFLTKSRAGIGLTALSSIFFVGLSFGGGRWAPVRRDGQAPQRWTFLRRVGLLLVVVVAIIGLFELFGQSVLYRLQIKGTADGRLCVLPGMIEAARQAWPYGSGAGTFDVYFQAFRDPGCGIYGAWDKAHNFFLEGVITLGASFAVLCAVAYAALLLVLIRGWSRRRRLRQFPAAGLAILLLLTLHDLVDFSLQIPGIAIASAAILAACCAIALAPKGGDEKSGAKPLTKLSSSAPGLV